MASSGWGWPRSSVQARRESGSPGFSAGARSAVAATALSPLAARDQVAHGPEDTGHDAENI